MTWDAELTSPRDSVFHLLRVVLQEHGARWAELLAAPGLSESARDLTKPRYAILRAVHAEPGIDQGAAGAQAGSDKATVTALLDRLERQGLIRRQVDGSDRRRRRLYLTEQGVALLAEVVPILEQANAELLARLTTPERDELLRLLHVLAGQ